MCTGWPLGGGDTGQALANKVFRSWRQSSQTHSMNEAGATEGQMTYLTDMARALVSRELRTLLNESKLIVPPTDVFPRPFASLTEVDAFWEKPWPRRAATTTRARLLSVDGGGHTTPNGMMGTGVRGDDEQESSTETGGGVSYTQNHTERADRGLSSARRVRPPLECCVVSSH